MKRLILSALILAGSLSVFAQTARLQVIHNSPDPTVDVWIEAPGAAVPPTKLLPNFAFRTASPFVDAPAGTDLTIGVALAGSSSIADTLVGFTVNLTPGETYVALASGIVGDPTTPFGLLIKDMARESALGSGVDFFGVHGSTDAPTVDIIARDVAILLDDVSYGDVSGYLNVPAGSYILDVTPGDDNYNVVASFAADLSGLDGGSAVVFASGFLSGATPAFGLFAALADGTVVPFAAVPAETTEVQVIHNAPDPTVDIYINGALAVDSFTFRSATPFVDVPAGPRVKIDVAPHPSSSAADAIATFEGKFRSDRKYVLLASGVVGDPITPFTVVGQGNIKTSNNKGAVFAIVAHGSPDAPTVDVVVDGAGLILVNDLSYPEITRYIGVPPASYTLNITPGSDTSTVVASYLADLSGLADSSVVIFASGFFGGGTPGFGLFVAFPSGTVVELPAAPVLREGDFRSVDLTGIRQNSTSVNVDVAADAAAEASIEVFSLSGQLLSQRPTTVDAGNSTWTVDVSNLSNGTYVLVLRTAEGVQTEKFSLTR